MTLIPVRTLSLGLAPAHPLRQLSSAPLSVTNQNYLLSLKLFTLMRMSVQWTLVFEYATTCEVSQAPPGVRFLGPGLLVPTTPVLDNLGTLKVDIKYAASELELELELELDGSYHRMEAAQPINQTSLVYSQ